MRKNIKSGISLIVLVITIIVMIILAATIIISLNNAGIIGAAHNAVCMTNIKQAQNLAVLTWSNMYTKPDDYNMDNIEQKLKDEFEKNGLKYEDYNVEVTKNGIEVSSKAGCTDTSGVEGGSGNNSQTIDPNWAYAYTYTEAEGWSQKISKTDVTEEVSGTIVARLYETGRTVSYEDMGIPEGQAYKMVITGTGDLKLGVISDEDVPTETYAWFTETWDFLNRKASQFIMAYVTDVEIQKGIDCVGTAAFYAGVNMQNVAIPNSVTVIDDSAFALCQSLESIILPDGVEKIGVGAFARCTALTNLTLPNGLKEIGDKAFLACEKLTLTSPVFPQGITKMGEGAFSECESLTKVVLPGGIKTIPYSCFEYCHGSNGQGGLEEIVISEGTETITEYAFGNCNIKTITLPKSLKTIDRLAFTNSSITTINFAGTEEQWNAFGSINLPANVSIVYNYTGN